MHPHCAAALGLAGPPRTKTPGYVVVLGIVGAIMMVVVAVVRFGAPSKPASGRSDELASSEDLFAAYHANEVSADAKYKGKTIIVSGVVQSVDKDAFGGVVVALATSNQFMPARAHTSDAARAGSLTKGQRVNLRCIGGGMILGAPVLNDCAF